MSLITRRQPLTSTLFPYTTLFRSSSHVRRGSEGTGQQKPSTSLCPFLAPRGFPWSFVGHDGRARHRLPGAGAGRDAGHRADRKSTRLNSSHLGSSYAVFCLKKKIG